LLDPDVAPYTRRMSRRRPKFRHLNPESVARKIVRAAKRDGVRSYADMSEYLMFLSREAGLNEHTFWFAFYKAYLPDIHRAVMDRFEFDTELSEDDWRKAEAWFADDAAHMNLASKGWPRGLQV